MPDATDVDIAEFHPGAASGGDFAAWHHVVAAATAADLPGDPLPTLDFTVAELLNPDPNEKRVNWLARLDGDPAGVGWLSLLDPPNERLAYIEAHVAPALRRRGIGTSLVRTAVERALDEHRSIAGVEIPEGSAGIGLAEKLGFSCGLHERRSLLTLADVPPAVFAGAAGDPPAGYGLLRWVGRVPEDFLAAYIAAKEGMGDTPTGDLDWRPPTWDRAKWRAYERVIDRRGSEYRIVVAVHEQTGAIAALTELAIRRSAPRRADQDDTVVVPAHRGNGLGMLVKRDMLRWLRDDRPEVAEIQTWNADSNVHMIAINERLGFRKDRVWWDYEADLDELAKRLDLTA